MLLEVLKPWTLWLCYSWLSATLSGPLITSGEMAGGLLGLLMPGSPGLTFILYFSLGEGWGEHSTGTPASPLSVSFFVSRFLGTGPWSTSFMRCIFPLTLLTMTFRYPHCKTLKLYLLSHARSDPRLPPYPSISFPNTSLPWGLSSHSQTPAGHFAKRIMRLCLKCPQKYPLEQKCNIHQMSEVHTQTEAINDQ